MVFLLVRVVVRNVSAGVNLNHVLKLDVDDKINRFGGPSSKIELDAKVPCFISSK